MKTTILAFACAGVLAFAGTAVAKAPAYYVSMGDSLAVGVQPDAAGVNHNTHNGYDQQLALAFSRMHPGLKHISLGCGGSTTASMINGTKACDPVLRRPYRNTSKRQSQLAWGERFIKRNRSRIKLVTLTIGANDLLGCVDVAAGKLNAPCLQSALAKLNANFGVVAKRLRAAAGAGIPMVVSTYYNPLLASLLKGDQLSTLLGQTSIGIIEGQVNSALRTTYGARGFKVAEVGEAFKINTPLDQLVAVPGIGSIPIAVASTCQLTYMCAPAPVGPNIHPTTTGYGAITQAFTAAAGIG